jgi:hypothetical protein
MANLSVPLLQTIELLLCVAMAACAVAAFVFWNEPGCGCVLAFQAVRLFLYGPFSTVGADS